MRLAHESHFDRTCHQKASWEKRPIHERLKRIFYFDANSLLSVGVRRDLRRGHRQLRVVVVYNPLHFFLHRITYFGLPYCLRTGREWVHARVTSADTR